MSYKKSYLKKHRTKKKHVLSKSLLILAIPFALMAGAERYLPQEWPVHIWIRHIFQEITSLTREHDPMPLRSVRGELTVDFLDVGQGSCALITLDEHAMLYDCGPDDKGTYIEYYLQKQGIRRLDYVIGSHPDADHIGGMDVVLTKFECDTVLMPGLERDTAAYRDVKEVLRYRGYRSIQPSAGTVYDFGDAQFVVLGPIQLYPEEPNNNSIVIRLKYGANTFLFTGDAQTDEERDILESGEYLRSQVYLAGHHGSRNASSPEFLAAVQPEYAVISCDPQNDYGHPHEETLERLQSV